MSFSYIYKHIHILILRDWVDNPSLCWSVETVISIMVALIYDTVIGRRFICLTLDGDDRK